MIAPKISPKIRPTLICRFQDAAADLRRRYAISLDIFLFAMLFMPITLLLRAIAADATYASARAIHADAEAPLMPLSLRAARCRCHDMLMICRHDDARCRRRFRHDD